LKPIADNPRSSSAFEKPSALRDAIDKFRQLEDCANILSPAPLRADSGSLELTEPAEVIFLTRSFEGKDRVKLSAPGGAFNWLWPGYG